MRDLADQQRGQVIVAAIESVATGLLPRIIAEYHIARPAFRPEPPFSASRASPARRGSVRAAANRAQGAACRIAGERELVAALHRSPEAAMSDRVSAPIFVRGVEDTVRRSPVAFGGGAVIGALGGLIGLGGAEFRLPLR
jgi:hypothetical protein